MTDAFKLSFLMLQLLLLSLLPNAEEGSHQANAEKKGSGHFEVPFSRGPIKLDAKVLEAVWTKSPWHSLNYRWMGDSVAPSDYHGRFKLAWDAEHLYIFAEIKDDLLHPMLQDGLANFWKGDYLEVFLDADVSGGPHEASHQAFAYHIGSNGRAIDRGVNGDPIFFDEHVQLSFRETDAHYYWEIALSIYGANFKETGENEALKLLEGMQLGFSLAYGDNDGHGQRENFMGSKASHGQNNDEGYTNADVFGRITLGP